MNTAFIKPFLKNGVFHIRLENGEEIQLVSGVQAPHRDFSHCDLSMLKLDGANFDGCLFDKANLAATDFSYASLNGAILNECALEDVIFVKASMENAEINFGQSALRLRFDQANLTEAVFTGDSKVRIKDSIFREAQLFGTKFQGFELNSCSFTHCDASNSSWNRMNLDEVDLHSSSLVLAHFENCEWDEVFFNDSIMNGATFSNCLTYFIGVSFNGADMSQSVFQGCHFKNSSIEAIGANFTGAWLVRSQFFQGNFEGARFDHAYVHSSGFNESTQSGTSWDAAHIINSRFRRCYFDETSMNGASFFNCSLQEAVFNTQQSRAALFENCQFGPSIPVQLDEAA